MLIKAPPSNVENEIHILANIIMNDKLMRDIVDIVTPKMFHNEENKQIYLAMLYLYHNNQSIGYKTLINRLQFKGFDLTDIVLDLTNSLVHKHTFENSVELLKEDFQKRELYELSKYILSNDISGVASGNLVKKIEDKIERMGITSNIEVEKFEDYIDEWLKYQEDETPIQSHKLGYKLLDDLVLLEDTNLMLIGARPSVGKSALATNLVKNFCLQGEHPLFVSLEMNKKEFMNRLVSNMAHIPARKLKRKEPKSNEEWAKIMVAKDKISKFKFNFYDKGGMKIEQLQGLCRYLKKKDELDVLVIDYLQLLESNQYRGQKQYQVAYISQQLKQLAMELEIPVIALSQLSRGVVSDGGSVREPVLSDLRDSGKKLPVIPFPFIKGVLKRVLTRKPNPVMVW